MLLFLLVLTTLIVCALLLLCYTQFGIIGGDDGIIRRTELTDKAYILAFLKEWFTPEKYARVEKDFDIGFIREIDPKNHSYVYVINDTPIGFVSAINQGDSLYIANLYISEKHRGKGYAGELMDYIAQFYKNFKRVYLDTKKDYHLTPVLLKFYGSKGFEMSENETQYILTFKN